MDNAAPKNKGRSEANSTVGPDHDVGERGSMTLPRSTFRGMCSVIALSYLLEAGAVLGLELALAELRHNSSIHAAPFRILIMVSHRPAGAR
jgi:hypothetical protein